MAVDGRLQPAATDDAELAAQLIYATMGSMADYLLGGDDASQAHRMIALLFRRPKNRYSYQYADLALVDGEVVGLLLSYPGTMMKALHFPMVKNLFAVNGFRAALRFFYRSLPLMTVKEVEADEYFINNVAVFPQFQGHGVGKLLMELAEQKARASGLQKCALTVDIENERAVGLYKHLGYQVMDTVKIKQLERRMGFSGIYRMVKILEPVSGNQHWSASAGLHKILAKPL